MPSRRSLEAQARRREARERRRSRRKVILFLVEGLSEVRALETPIAAMMDAVDGSVDVRFQIMTDRHRLTREDKVGGDITSKIGVEPDNVEHVIEKTFLTPFFREYGLYPRDVQQIAHIIDLDGAFVPDDLVIQAPSGQEGVLYADDHILAPSVESILMRNAQKRANVLRLASLDEIKAESKTVPYGAYFFSANLDHFLYGEANLDDVLKAGRASEFSMQCCVRPSLFFDTVQADERYGTCDYETSWEMVQEGSESLRPHTNLGILLRELMA